MLYLDLFVCFVLLWDKKLIDFFGFDYFYEYCVSMFVFMVNYISGCEF